ncbi:MAG: DNA mismatch repair protein MutS [Balneolaceae bacterium]
MSSDNQTPLMRQYFEIKEKHPGMILLFRVGDFYETFDEDAKLVSRELGITLTKRNNGKDQTPLAGFPYHSLDTYLPKLVRRGHRVAICEQTEEPEDAKKAGKKVVNREVTEITTPGVTLSEKLLDYKKNNYLAAVHFSADRAGVAFADISTGEFSLCRVSHAELSSLLESVDPAEILVKKGLKQIPGLSEEHGYNLSRMEEWIFQGDYGYRELTGHFGTHSLKGFGVEDLKEAHVAAGALLHYMRETQKATLSHVRRLALYNRSAYMSLDVSTRRNLELTTPMRDGGSDGTLVSILDRTLTAMGGRLFRKWLMRPLRERESIQARLDAVGWLLEKRSVRDLLREKLAEVGDLERLMSRISVGRTNARDLKQLSFSLCSVPYFREQLNGVKPSLLEQTAGELKELPEVTRKIDNALVDEPPAGLGDGGLIREGYHEELDDLRDAARNGKEYIAGIREQLIRDSGIPSLKIGYNKVFGYYIEVTNTHRDKVPDYFIRKQTLVNSERFITPELKEVEEKVLSAEERSSALEANLFEELRLEVAKYAGEVQDVASAVARLDCLQSFADVAWRCNYVKPVVNEEDKLEIRKGRHPVVERTLPAGEPFIPNDIVLDCSENQILMITGPNMAGKSIILRQTALIVLMAQIGSFVPAEEALIGLVDKIFTRVGASDNLAAGESTFMVEMNEAANILNNATPRSLILLDEIGRGTSTFDGLSIAWSLAEYLHNKADVAARTLFATHYHELNELEKLYPRIRNFNIQVREHQGRIIFMRKLVPGGADHSYGIQVADMAGLPVEVIRRAKEILVHLEKQSLNLSESGEDQPQGNGREGVLERAGRTGAIAGRVVSDVEKQEEIPQMSLFGAEPNPAMEQLCDRIKAVDPDRITPIDALALLSELKKLADDT